MYGPHLPTPHFRFIIFPTRPLTEKYHVLNIICEEAQNVNITEENKDIIFYQLTAARYGRDYMKFNIEWYKKLINEMENKK